MSTLFLKLFVVTQVGAAALTDRVRRTHADRGATAVEYGLLVALIAAVIIGVVVIFGTKISDIFSSTANKLPSGTTSTTP